MSFTSSDNSQKSVWSPPSAEWLRQRDAMAIEAYRQSNRNRLSFSYSPQK